MRLRQITDAVLPERLFLTRTVSLPRKAAARMQQVGTLDLLQKTPFKAEEIVWAIGPVRRDKDQVHMTQIIALKSDLGTWRKRMEAANRPLRRIYANVGEKDVVVADYDKELGKHRRFWPIANTVAAILALSCALYLWALPGLQASQKAAVLQPESERLQEQAIALRAHVRELRADHDRQQGILTGISSAPRLLDAIVAATTILPDTAWVSQYTFDPAGVRMFMDIDGSAVDLLYTLADEALLPNALMQGDVQRTSSGTEEFWLRHDHLLRQ
ncbi:hypothetical protein [Tateyamaria omphalii]|uniref:hypothetical protein n=1 Tax=Tateyamaria omphalii TaxID=299262 RepID=UPI0016741067|nr:hypothetical protein [Tateyamaria omphalii]